MIDRPDLLSWVEDILRNGEAVLRELKRAHKDVVTYQESLTVKWRNRPKELDDNEPFS